MIVIAQALARNIGDKGLDQLADPFASSTCVHGDGTAHGTGNTHSEFQARKPAGHHFVDKAREHSRRAHRNVNTVFGDNSALELTSQNNHSPLVSGVGNEDIRSPSQKDPGNLLAREHFYRTPQTMNSEAGPPTR